jgi:hypothetical protein
LLKVMNLRVTGVDSRVPPQLVNLKSLVIISEIISINKNRDREYCLLVEERNPFKDETLKNFSILFHKFGGPLTHCTSASRCLCGP